MSPRFERGWLVVLVATNAALAFAVEWVWSERGVMAGLAAFIAAGGVYVVVLRLLLRSVMRRIDRDKT